MPRRCAQRRRRRGRGGIRGSSGLWEGELGEEGRLEWIRVGGTLERRFMRIPLEISILYAKPQLTDTVSPFEINKKLPEK